MKLIHLDDCANYDVDFTHGRFLCKSGDHIFLSHLEFDEEDGYFVTDEHGQKYFMYGPAHTLECEVYLIVTNEEVGGDGGPPYDAATRTGMYDHD